MLPPKKIVAYHNCGNSKAKLTVTADDWEDSPKTFTYTWDCPASGKIAEGGILAAKMRELTGLSLTGWAS